MRSILILAFVLCFPAVTSAWATLCDDCMGKRYPANIGVCRSCGGTTSSGAFHTCQKCSAAKNICEHCGKSLGGAASKPASTQPDSAPAGDAATYTADDDGKTITVIDGKSIVVQLEGNITTGFSWELKSLKGESLKQTGKIQYVSNEAHKRFAGGPGKFFATFKAVKAGSGTIELVYIRPWEKNTPPNKTFTLTIKVEKPSTTQPTSKPAAQTQPTGNEKSQ